MNKVRKGLAAGGPAFIHVLDPCPKGWHYDPQYSHELGKLAVETGVWSLWEMENHEVRLNGTTRSIANGRFGRKPVREYLSNGVVCALRREDYEHFKRVDEQWTSWLIPGVVSFGIWPGHAMNLQVPAVLRFRPHRPNSRSQHFGGVLASSGGGGALRRAFPTTIGKPVVRSRAPQVRRRYNAVRCWLYGSAKTSSSV